MKRLSITLSLITLSLLSAMSQAKYLFLFIGDGMGMGHVNTTQLYQREVLKSDEPLLMTTFPVASQMQTYSADNKVTDSAASGTAIACGMKTNNGMVGVSPDTLSLQSIASMLHEMNYAVGIASTVAGDDATPAAFYAHSPSRGDKYKIAPMAAESRFDYFAAPVWRGSRGGDGSANGWHNLMENAGYNVVKGYESISDYTRPLLLLSQSPQGDQAGYTIDSIPSALTLQQITKAGITRLLNANPDRFFLMVEAGNIDWAAHANDGATVIKEIIHLQSAIAEAYEFYLKHPDETLIIVTADHDTGGMAFGRYDNEKMGDLSLVDTQRMSKDRFSDLCKGYLNSAEPLSWEEMQKILSDHLGLFSHVNVSDEELASIKESFDITFTRRQSVDQATLYNNFNQFAVTIFDILNRHMGIGWTTNSHTANLVPVYAIGCGADYFRAMINNSDIPSIIRQATDTSAVEGSN